MENKHTQQVDFSNPNADKITSGTTNKSLENKQTAVEWLINEAMKLVVQYMNGTLNEDTLDDVIYEIATKAKQIEKEQTEISDEEILKAAKECVYEDLDISVGSFELGAKWYREQLKNKQT